MLGLNSVQNLEHAFRLAKEKLAVEPLLDAEGSFNYI